MSKADELAKKMANQQPATFTPRESVEVKPIEKPSVEPKQAKESAQKAKVVELSVLYAKVPKGQKHWLDHRKIDTGQELGEIISEAIALLQAKHEKK